MSWPTLPTAFRFMNDAEWEIVTRVFTAQELPWRFQVGQRSRFPIIFF